MTGKKVFSEKILLIKLLNMRIISGRFKNKKIFLPTNKITRPLKDIVRESIFNIIEHSNNEYLELKGAKILDFFAGTGSFGIECLSRGAKKTIFFENYPSSNKILKKNLITLKLEKKTRVFESNTYNFSKDQLGQIKFDLIFLDPPFLHENINELIEKIKKTNIADKNTLIILHRNKKTKEKINDRADR